MIKITCLIIDDEPLALDLLERYVNKTPYLDLKARCSSAIEALDIINSMLIDLIFVDIQMPELTGLEFSRTLNKDTKLIFTTAFSEYAIESYKVNALDYLLKPFNYEEFLKATNKAKEWFDLVKSEKIIEQGETSNFMFVKSEYKQIKINLNDVLYFEGLKDYVKIWLKDTAKPILTIMTLKSLEEKLSTEKFMRIHRSFIISLDKIDIVERGQVLFPNSTRITIAEQYKTKFNDFISGNSFS
jgi:DNA-binding LytR/AlgR family response regulator